MKNNGLCRNVHEKHRRERYCQQTIPLADIYVRKTYRSTPMLLHRFSTKPNNAILIALMLAVIISAGCTSKTPTASAVGNDSTVSPPAQPPVIPEAPAANTTQTATNLTEPDGGLSESDITIDQPPEENVPFDEPPAF